MAYRLYNVVAMAEVDEKFETLGAAISAAHGSDEFEVWDDRAHVVRPASQSAYSRAEQKFRRLAESMRVRCAGIA
jgi:hypothetical protein